MNPLFEIRDVTVGYERDIDVVKDVSIKVMPGCLTGMIGLNGAGKSTLMKAAYGFLVPKKGGIYLKGEDITGVEPHTMVQRGIWLLPQESSLYPFLSVEDNLRMALRGLKLGRTETEARMEHAFVRFRPSMSSSGSRLEI